MGNPYQRHHGIVKLAKDRYLVHNREQIVWACRERHQRSGHQVANFNVMHLCGDTNTYPCIIEIRHTYHGVANRMEVMCTALSDYEERLQRELQRIRYLPPTTL